MYFYVYFRLCVRLSKILKCGSNDDIVTIKAEDNADTVQFIFETPSKFVLYFVIVSVTLN